jgi:hypothetical protein
MWTTFNKWLTNRLRLLEVSELFDRRAYNELFFRELDRLIIRGDPELESKLMSAKGFDYVGYISMSLRNAGFQDADIDPWTHQIVVQLLVEPGNLFENGRASPLKADLRRPFATPSSTSLRNGEAAEGGMRLPRSPQKRLLHAQHRTTTRKGPDPGVESPAGNRSR